MSDFFKSRSWVVAFASLTLLFSFTSAKAAPENNEFLDATRLSGSFVQIEGTTVEADEEAGEPDIFTSYLGREGSVWYRWVSPSRRGKLTLALEVFRSNNGAVFGFNHGIDLYMSSNDSIFDLYYLNGGSVTGGEIGSGVWNIPANKVFYVRIAYLGNSAPSHFEFTLNFSPDPKTSPAYYKRAIRKANSKLRIAKRKRNNRAIRKLRKQIKNLKRALRRV